MTAGTRRSLRRGSAVLVVRPPETRSASEGRDGARSDRSGRCASLPRERPGGGSMRLKVDAGLGSGLWALGKIGDAARERVR